MTRFAIFDAPQAGDVEIPSDDMVEPSEEEKRNGWTAESLTAYLRERGNAQFGMVTFDPEYRSPRRPRQTNGDYNPHRW